ncbi:MAG TPA: HEAT repeat domain-containing protein, partial [Streptosporangiaceae bacterium]
LHDPAWQVRVGAAQALAAAGPQLALASLGGATADPHADVRKAAVISLAAQAGLPAAREILHAALADTDADVRAYARHALAGDQPAGPAIPVS